MRNLGLDSEQLSVLYSTVNDIVKDKYAQEARVKKIPSPIVDSNGSKKNTSDGIDLGKKHLVRMLVQSIHS